MKKNEIRILAVIAALALAAIAYMKLAKPKGSGVTVAIQYRNDIVQEFDPAFDAVYTIEGDYGTLDVEVVDGKWHVINEVCPNHICAQMGWMSADDIAMPITCLPNNIIIYVEETAE